MIENAEEIKYESNNKETLKPSLYIPIIFGLIFIYFSLYYVETPPQDSNRIPENYSFNLIVFVLPISMSILSTLICSIYEFKTFISSWINSFFSVGIIVVLYLLTTTIMNPSNFSLMGLLFFLQIFLILLLILTFIGSIIGYFIFGLSAFLLDLLKIKR